MSDIFISHVEEDSRLAFEIAAGLEASGYSTWYYERDSLPGPSYLLQTSREIESAQAVVLIISSDSLGSHQVTKEVVRAHESGKRIAPVLKSISYTESAARQPEWKEAIGSNRYITASWKAAAIVPQILEDLRAAAIEPRGDTNPVLAGTFLPAQPPRKKPLFRVGPLRIFPATAVIAAAMVLSLLAGGVVMAARDREKNPTIETLSREPRDLPVLRPKAKTVSTSSEFKPADTAESPVATKEVKSSAGVLTIDRVVASDRFMQCPASGRCTQRSGGKFVLGITFRSIEGKSTTELQRALTQEGLSSYVKTPQGNRVEAFNFDLISPKSAVTIIYAYMDAGITSGLVLYWRGNPPIAIQTGVGSTSGDNSPGGEGSGSSGSYGDDPFPDSEPFADEEPFPDEEPPPDEEPFPDEEPPPDLEPPPDEEPPPPYEEPPPDEEPPPE